MPEGTSPINPTDLNTLNSNAPSPSMIAAAPKPPKPPRNLLPVVIILAILTLAGLGTSIFFGLQSSSQSSEISDLKSQLGLAPDQPSTPATPSDPVPDKSQILAGIPASLMLANANCLNSEMYNSDYNFETRSNGLSNGSGFFYSVSYNAATSTPSLYINWDFIFAQENPLYGLSTARTGEEVITDFGLSGKATDAIFAQLSYQATGYEYILFLMEDGTVEYLPLAQAFGEGNFKSHGKLEGITDVIKFYTGTAAPTGAPIGFGPDVLAQRADGDYYSLITAVQATGTY